MDGVGIPWRFCNHPIALGHKLKLVTITPSSHEHDMTLQRWDAKVNGGETLKEGIILLHFQKPKRNSLKVHGWSNVEQSQSLGLLL